MPGQVAANEKQLRYERLMQAQQRVVSARNDSMLGSKHKVLVEGTHTDTELLLAGRAEFQAPEVDSCVIINEIDEGLPQPSAGDFVTVQISDVAGYDLVARMIAN